MLGVPQSQGGEQAPQTWSTKSTVRLFGGAMPEGISTRIMCRVLGSLFSHVPIKSPIFVAGAAEPAAGSKTMNERSEKTSATITKRKGRSVRLGFDSSFGFFLMDRYCSLCLDGATLIAKLRLFRKDAVAFWTKFALWSLSFLGSFRFQLSTAT